MRGLKRGALVGTRVAFANLTRAVLFGGITIAGLDYAGTDLVEKLMDVILKALPAKGVGVLFWITTILSLWLPALMARNALRRGAAKNRDDHHDHENAHGEHVDQGHAKPHGAAVARGATALVAATAAGATVAAAGHHNPTPHDDHHSDGDDDDHKEPDDDDHDHPHGDDKHGDHHADPHHTAGNGKVAA